MLCITWLSSWGTCFHTIYGLHGIWLKNCLTPDGRPHLPGTDLANPTCKHDRSGHSCVPSVRGEKTMNTKHVNIFQTALAGQPGPVPRTNETKWRFYFGTKQKTAGLSQGRIPVYPRDRSSLPQGQFLFIPNTVPPKMFMICFFPARVS